MLPGTSMIDANAPLPDLLMPNGQIKLLPAAELDRIPRDSLRLWCHKNARYGLMTEELIAWLRDFIGDRRAIEIGSGTGDLAHHLGIVGTDNKCQTWDDVRLYYQVLGQPTIRYPAWVETCDALEAVQKHQPQVVVASWVTNWIDPDKPAAFGDGSMHGIREDLLLETGVTFVMLGNLRVHARKPILSRRHDEIELPFLRSRAAYPELDRIFVWHGTR